MKIADFTRDYIPDALALARANYQEERQQVSVLPPVDTLPDLTGFADNGLGAVALEEGRLIGFLGFYPPRDEVYTTYARGTFSPIEAHGAQREKRGEIYQRLYQAAAEKLVERGVSNHSIGLYAHDTEAIKALYTYGFGLRCMDAMRPMQKIECPPCPGYAYGELPAQEKNRLLPLKNLLIRHLGESPAFMSYPPLTVTELEKEHDHRQARYFCAYHGADLVAFLEASDDWENFASAETSVKNICGAFCLPEHRGKGLYQNLLNHAIAVLKGEGYPRLGVDFESINPTAAGFWLKYFQAYTHGVVRQIDEKILGKDGGVKG